MNIIEINSVDYGSTGKIMFHISDAIMKKGYVVHTFTKKWKKRKTKKNHSFFGYTFDNAIHVILASLLGLQGFFSLFSTLNLINSIKKIKPDIVHLHNIHDSCINFPMLFKYLNKTDIIVMWTFHDCWAFTGGCYYFDLRECEKWKSGCVNCPLHIAFGGGEKVWKIKQKMFVEKKKLYIVTPSQWLNELVKKSFLHNCEVKVINNGIDTRVFRPRKSNFRVKNELLDKKIILGVAYKWEKRKGLDVFIELNRKLDSKYQIVLVGTDNDVDLILKKQEKRIISIHRTSNQKELAEIYSCADLFVNPTREENFPTVNIEALACGTPVLTFNTGGSGEMLDETCGKSIVTGDIEELLRETISICETNRYKSSDCRKHAENYDQKKVFQEYVEYFEQIMTREKGIS